MTITVATSVTLAADYKYDDLNRVISSEKDGKTTTYTYDHGGNLLSVKSTAAPARQKDNIISGWTPYMTKAVKAQYHTASENVYGDAPVTIYQSVSSSVYGDTTVSGDVYETISSDMNVQWIEVNAKRTGGANIYRDIPVDAGSSYSYEGWVKSDEMKDSVVQVIVNYYDNRNRLVSYDNILNLKQNSIWHNYQASLRTPSRAVKARVHLQVVLLKSNGHAKAGFADRTFERAVQEGGKQ
ncbi:RHS repeat domain-containing protein [Paenibacillus wulumuqiensis]|uniref:RHS repeat domain-containing protein n=1 Tax=Paenibacillus wulumuqiensis TaxID=1567107 RepID=UPI0009E5A533|nr:RHS repeat domain-containing protein [Paenibacillus wulumuqiensis]